jgi:hypothetical protein
MLDISPACCRSSASRSGPAGSLLKDWIVFTVNLANLVKDLSLFSAHFVPLEYFAVVSISHAFSNECRVRNFLHFKNVVTVATIRPEVVSLIRENSLASRPEPGLSDA